MSKNNRVIVITGVSRLAGIGFALAKHFLGAGNKVLIQSWAAHDLNQPHGTASIGIDEVINKLQPKENLAHLEVDLSEKGAPSLIIRTAMKSFGAIDVLIINHAASITGDLLEVTTESLDEAWSVNARAGILLAQEFVKAHDDNRSNGRIIFFTSGQHLGPMPNELPYAISKAAIQQMVPSLADYLAGRGITVNAINPGPNDTGWAGHDLYEEIKKRFPLKRWGTPEDVVPVVSFLASQEAGWVTGQTLNVEGGFRRFD